MSSNLLNMPILRFLEAQEASVRLRNAIRASTENGLFPLKIVSELVRSIDNIELLLHGIPNIGRKTTTELKRLAALAAYQAQDPSGERPTKAEEAPDHHTSVQGLDLDAAIKRLSDRERSVIIHRFGLAGERIKTLAEIGNAFGVTRERIRQLEAKLLTKLQNRCRSTLRAELDTRGPQIWERITNGSHALRGPDKLRGSTQLTPRENLEIMLAYGSFEAWLQHSVKKTKQGWIATDIEPAVIAEALRAIAKRFSAVGEPDHLVHYQNECATSAKALDAALALAENKTTYCDYVVKRPSTRRIRRAIHAHLLPCWPMVPTPIPLHVLRENYVQANPHDPCSTRDLSIVFTDATHLFLNMYEEGWVAIGPRGTDLRDLSTNHDGESTADEPEPKSEVQQTASGRLRKILGARGPMIFDDLREEFMALGGYAQSSVGPLLLNIDVFVRLAPAVYGLRTHLKDAAAIARGKQLLLEARHCEFYCRARWANEPREFYPLWTVDMEHAWAVWAKQQGLTTLLGALLYVSNPKDWPVNADERNYWTRLKDRLGVFQMQEPITVPLIATMPTLSEVVATAILARMRGGLSWISLNRVRGARIDDRHSHTVLALLITLGIIEPAAHWQDRHVFRADSSTIVEELTEQLSASGSREWTRQALEMFNDAFLQEKELGWLGADDVSAILDKLALDVPDASSSTKTTVERQKGAGLDDLIAAMRLKKAIGAVVTIDHRRSSSDASEQMKRRQ